jgi:polyisoprenoid-binding protein YceI
VPVAKPVTSPAPAQTARPASTSTAQATGAVRFELADGSEARYRIKEQLARVNLPSDAVGATRDVKGTIVLDGTGKLDRELSRIEVDLRSLRSDSGNRDRTISNQMLQVSRYPTVTFVPTELRGLPWPLPSSGETEFEMVGDLTIREVTRPVTWQVTAQLAQGQASGQAKTSVPLEQFELKVPSVASVLSTEDTVRLEIDFKANRAGG